MRDQPNLQAPRELAHRACDGLEVALLWTKASDSLTLSVIDARMGEWFELPVEASRALAAFHHPFAFAASQGVEFRAPARDESEETVGV